MLKNDSIVTLVLLSMCSITEEGEAWMPSQPEPRQDVVLRVIPYPLIPSPHILRCT